MANEQIQRYDWNTGRKSLNSEHVMYSDHVAATNELREGQMHLAMEVDAKDEQIRKLREQVARLSASVSDEEMNQFAIHSVDLAMPYRREPALLRSSADALILARKEGR